MISNTPVDTTQKQTHLSGSAQTPSLYGGTSGGVKQNVIGRASGLVQPTDGGDEHPLRAFPDHDESLRPYIEGYARRSNQQTAAAANLC